MTLGPTLTRTLAYTLAASLALLLVPTSLADNVQNDVHGGGDLTIAEGGFVSVNYTIIANNGDGQRGCNAADGSPALLQVQAPAGVIPTPSSLTFTACDVGLPVNFTSTIAGQHSVSVTVSDGGAGTYNTAPASLKLKVEDLAPPAEEGPAPDVTAPTISFNVSHGPGPSGWYNIATGAPTVSFTCADANLSSCTASITLGEGADQAVTGTAVDLFGNNASIVAGPFHVDRTAPSIVASLVPGGALAYNLSRGAPSAAFACEDHLSGIASCPDDVVLGEGLGQSALGTAFDIAGNSASASSDAADIDLTAPGILANVSHAPAESGWYNLATGAPTISFACDDASGVASCSDPVTLGEGRNQTVVGTVVDAFGNSASVVAGPFDVDLTPPAILASLSAAPSESGWYSIASGAPSVLFDCSDGLSGIASCSDDALLVEGANQSAEGVAVDLAGNSASATSDAVDIDLTPPALVASLSFAANVSGWYNIASGAPSAQFECSDDLSGVASCSDDALLGEGADQSAEGIAVDLAGNSASASSDPADIDLTAPSILAGLSPAAAGSGWYNLATGAPTASFECEDLGSGIASCTPPSVLGEGLDQGAQGTAVDRAGNSASDATEPADIDLTAPSLSLPDSVSVLATAVGGGPASFSASASDNLDAAPRLVCSAASGDVFPLGTTVVSCEAVDAAGNTALGSFNVTVRYNAQGFFQPVKANKLNVVKAGSTVPLKFAIKTPGGGSIGDLAAVTQFTTQAVPCVPMLSDPLQFTTTGGTSLRYDAVAGQFIQNWKTPATKGCVRTSVELADGTVLSALFQLK